VVLSMIAEEMEGQGVEEEKSMSREVGESSFTDTFHSNDRSSFSRHGDR